MGLVEGVVGGALVLGPQRLGDLPLDAVADAALEELVLERWPSARRSSCRSPCAGRRPGRARSRRAPWRSASPAPGRCTRPACAPGSARGAVVGVGDGLEAVLAPRVQRDVLHRARPVQRHERDRGRRTPSGLHLRAGPRACRSTRTGRRRARRRCEHRERRRVVERQRSPCRAVAARTPRSSRTASSMTSRLRRPRKSILSRPSASTSPIAYWVTTRLVDALALQRQVLEKRAVADHDGGGVDAVLPDQALERPRGVDQVAGGDVAPSAVGRSGSGRRRPTAAPGPASCSRRSRP